MSSGSIVLVLTGPLHKATGLQEVALPCRETCSLGEVLGQFLRQYPAAVSVCGLTNLSDSPLDRIPPGLLVLRDNALLPLIPSTEIGSSQRLTLMPMISGG